MSDEAKVRELLAPFTERAVDLEGREFVVNRAAAVAVILRSVQQQQQRARPRPVAVWAGAIAAGLAMAASGLLFLGRHDSAQSQTVARASVADVAGNVTHWQAGALRTVPTGGEQRPIEPKGELRTGSGSTARLRDARGAEIALLENSRLVLDGLDGASGGVQLLAGSIRCEVPQLAAGHRFSVVTPHGTVEVRGTAFSVLVTGIAAAARTCVMVERGSVAIFTPSSETQLAAGQSWGCEPEATAPDEKRVPAVASDAASLASASSDKSSPDRGRPKPAKAGTLDEENRLFQAGLAAERRADLRAAHAAFEQLLTRYPSSPLAGDARAAQARLQQPSSP